MGFKYETMKDEDRAMDYEELLHEFRCLRTMFHAAVKSNGGVLTVTDKDISMVHFDSKLTRFNDSKNSCVVFESHDLEEAGGES